MICRALGAEREFLGGRFKELSKGGPAPFPNTVIVCGMNMYSNERQVTLRMAQMAQMARGVSDWGDVTKLSQPQWIMAILGHQTP